MPYSCQTGQMPWVEQARGNRVSCIRPTMRCLLAFILASAAFAEKVDLLRDDFWVAHIYATTPAGAAFGSGYAQAEDRLEELMRNYRKAEGTMAEAFGPEWYRHDVLQRMWGHRRV